MGNGPSLSGAVGKGAGGPFIQLNERAPRSIHMIAELVETGEAGARLLTAWNIEHHYRLPPSRLHRSNLIHYPLPPSRLHLKEVEQTTLWKSKILPRSV